jgi:2-keto-4-pentenoate hydratase
VPDTIDRQRETQLEDTAARLRAAYARGPIAPLRSVLEPTDGDGAYAIQKFNTRYWTGHGRTVTGRKIGLTSLAVQRQLGVDQPDFGVLFADMGIADGGELLASRVLQPKAEGEVAFVLSRGIDNPDATRDDVIAATKHVVAAIEIVDSRIADWKITFADTVADNGSSAFYVLGSKPRPLEGLDLWSCGMVLEVNEKVASLGAGAACLGHPLDSAAWLARTLAKAGDPLRAGDVLLTGALGPMVALAPGDRVRVTIGGLGTVGFSYRKDTANA